MNHTAHCVKNPFFVAESKENEHWSHKANNEYIISVWIFRCIRYLFRWKKWSYSLWLKRKNYDWILKENQKSKHFILSLWKNITTIKEKTILCKRNSYSELWKMKHLLKFTLHYDCGSEEKSTSVLFRFCEFPEGRNIQRYLQCAVNEKNPIAPYYSINKVTKNMAKGFFVKQETRH